MSTTTTTTTTTTVDVTARAAIGSACGEVRDAGEGYHVDGVPAALVARPAATEQVSEVMRAADAHGLTVVPTGRRTKLTWGRPPTSADVLLDLSGLDRVLEHSAGDLIVVTQTGARLVEVQDTLATSRQMLAVDETVPGSTIGGTLAAATAGPGRVAAGTMRDLLIGVSVVRVDGVVAKAGGRVVKNVAGYDVGKLMVGSFGTLAVVTQAVFRLHPLPATRRWVTAPFDDAAQAHRLTQQVLHSHSVPQAVEVDWPAKGPGTVGVMLAGTEAGVAGRTSAVRNVRWSAPAHRLCAVSILPPCQRRPRYGGSSRRRGAMSWFLKARVAAARCRCTTVGRLRRRPMPAGSSTASTSPVSSGSSSTLLGAGPP